MKLNYRTILLTLLLGVVFLPIQKSIAQDTLTVQWANTDGTVKVNALRDAITNDKTPPAGRVYKLLKGGFYWVTDRIDVGTRALRIVGQTPVKTDALQNPAVIQMVRKADGTTDGRMITGNGDMILKNLYITGRDDQNTQTYYQPIQIDGNNTVVRVDNCVIERTNFAMIAWTGKGGKIFFTNNKFRNLVGQPSTQQWEGRGMSIWADADTVVVENNTFFNVHFTPFQLEGGAGKYIRFNHNTLVNIGRQVNQASWLREAYFSNLLMVNGFWQGEGLADYSLTRNPNRDPRATTTGMFLLAALPTSYGPVEGRRIVFASASNFRDAKLTTYYKDTIRAQPFLNQVSIQDFVKKYPANIFVKDTLVQQDPGLKTYPSDIIDKMIQNIKDLRAGVTPATAYMYKETQFPTDIAWPLPEDFSYTNATLQTKGTDGLPLGDLNWFPTQLASFNSKKAAAIASVENIAGAKVVFTPVATAEAETGTIAGTAASQAVNGFVYIQLNSGGDFRWNFTLPAAAQLDMNTYVNLKGRATSGINWFVNDVEFHDPRGWGQYVLGNDASSVYPSFNINAWAWWLVKQSQTVHASDGTAGSGDTDKLLTFKAGANSIRIKDSWAAVINFGEIDLLTPGTTTIVKKLTATDVDMSTAANVAQVVEGAVWTPSGLKSVAMGTNGTVTMSVTAPSAGTYRINAIYQNLGSAGTSTLKVDGTTVDAALAIKAPTPKITKPTQIDSLGNASLSASFALTAGAHQIALTGSNFSLDMIQLIQETKIVGVQKENIPTGYALDQNYPNPFNPTTKINFSIGQAANVKLTVYNMLGQKVATLVNGVMNAGAHSVQFDATRLSSGVYFYGIETDNFTSYKKMMLLK